MNKPSRGDGISVELFQILKDDAVKVLNSICQQIGKMEQWRQDLKRSVFKKGNAKECSNICTTALISHAREVMLRILQARLQQYVNFQKFKLDLEKAKEPEIKLPTPFGSSKKQEFQKNSNFCFDSAKAFDCVGHNKLCKTLKEMGIPGHLTCLLSNLHAGQEATVRPGYGTTD